MTKRAKMEDGSEILGGPAEGGSGAGGLAEEGPAEEGPGEGGPGATTPHAHNTQHKHSHKHTQTQPQTHTNTHKHTHTPAVSLKLPLLFESRSHGGSQPLLRAAAGVLRLAGVLSGSEQRPAWRCGSWACFQEVLRHRGGQLTMLGAALSQALKELEAPAPVSRSDAAERAPASSTDAAECVMQVDEGTGLDAQPASSGGVAGCDGDLFTEEAGEELLSEPLSEGTVVRIVGLQKRWELNSRTGRLLGPREFDGRVPVSGPGAAAWWGGHRQGGESPCES